MRRDRYRSGLGGVYGHRDRTHDRTQPEPLRHGRRGRYRRGRTHGTSPYGQLCQRRSFVFTLGYVIQIIWRNARLKPQQAANTPGLPSA